MLDATTFRTALGRLASGVSVVTTVGPDGRDHGITVTALCSVSLQPPLLLVCIERSATIHAPLASATHFAVNVLAREQETLSRRFAETAGDKFRDIAAARGVHGCALLDDALAHIECARWAEYDGGDHTIFVGRAMRAEIRDAHPLLYYRGGYAGLDA